MKIGRILHQTIALGSILSLFGMIVCVIIQVFTRFFLDSAPSWTEEMSRVFFIYSIAFGMALAFRDDTIIKLDLINRYVSDKAIILIQGVISLLISFFGLVLFWYAIDFAKSGLNEKSPAMEIEMVYTFLAIPVMMIIICIYSIDQVVGKLKKFKS